ncbi:two-component system, sensor histidine kinase ChiS [Thermoflexales bacterium]|nr:two-component system, sensor histidine kinase ChiS [Thermoflexales bacterium]
MDIDWISGLNFSIQFPVRPEGLILLGIYLLTTLLILFMLRHSIFAMRRREWLIFFALGALTLVLSIILPLRFAAPDFQPVPNLPQDTAVPAAPLFAALPLLLAALWLGMGPAVLLSAFSALIQAGLQSGQITQRYEVIAFGLVASFFIAQYYRGKLAAILRRPVIASLCGSLVAWAMMLPSFFVYTPGRPLEALNYAWPLYLAAFLPILTQGLLSGLLVEIINARWPHWRRRQIATQDPVWSRTLGRQLLVPFIAFTLLVMVLLLTVVSAVALRQATAQAIAQMSRDAQTASSDIEDFLRSGQNLLTTIATEPLLQTGTAQTQSTSLSAVMRQEPYFEQLLLFAVNGQLASYAPLDQRPAPTLEEQTLVQRTLQTGAPQRSEVFAMNQQAYLTFVVPIGEGQGALLGRANLQLNPAAQRLSDTLQQTLGAGVGYIVDNNQRIVIHPQADQVLQNWPLNPTLQSGESINGGTVYNDRFPDGTPRLLFVQLGQGSSWTTAIELPRISVLELALQISAPLLALLFLILIFASLGILVLTRAITRPIQELSDAAENITHGRLDQPIVIERDDEVGRLAQSFEQMRLSLKARVDDLSLLLHVSQTVSASLDIEQGVPPLLDGVRQATPARVARLITLNENGEPRDLFSRGEGPTELTQLDRVMVKLTAPSEQPILIDNVAKARSRAMLDPNMIGPGLKAVAAFPVRRQTRPIAVLWLGYAGLHVFVESEVNVLATIAGQAAVLLENARLYEASEGGRRQLAAVLTSTNDAVIVTDPHNRVLLCNPAAEQAFELPAGSAIDQIIDDAWAEPSVARLFPAGGSTETRTEEILLGDGRTLYGSASAIINSDGEVLGRVAVMRDITHLKELDAMKSEFVATVSHDLRAPLTYMRGYATMLPMVGPLSPKQQDYTEKVMAGIEQMTELIDDLLDLGRIEAGVGLVREICSLGDIARSVVETMKPQALSRGLMLRTGKLSERMIPGDQGLLRHATANLVENAIKYTPTDGTITVSVEEQDSAMVIAVKDTGIGIAAADQVRLFERFYRVKRRETVDIKGSGLGLAIVKSIAQWHRGRVWVESQLGEGATFYILIPFGEMSEATTVR